MRFLLFLQILGKKRKYFEILALLLYLYKAYMNWASVSEKEDKVIVFRIKVETFKVSLLVLNQSFPKKMDTFLDTQYIGRFERLGFPFIFAMVYISCVFA